MRRFLANGLLLVCFGTLVPVIVVESVTRLAPSLVPPPLRAVKRVYDARQAWEGMMTKDPYLGFKLKPGLTLEFPSEGRTVDIRTLDYGLGDIGFRDLGTEPPFDILAVGDSFAFCDDAPASSCWVRRLADATGLSAGTLGVNGYSSLAEARMLARYGAFFEPKVVLMSVFLNDFKDNAYFEEWLASGTDDFWLWMSRRRASALSDRLGRISVVYRLIDGARRFRRHPVKSYSDGKIEFVFRARPWWQALVRDPEHSRGWRLMRQALSEAAEATQELGARLVVLLFPFKEQVYWERLRAFFPEAGHGDVDAPFRVIGEYLDAHGIPYCDLTDGFRREGEKGKQLYLKVSGHWNDAGYALAGELVASCLEERGILRCHRGGAKGRGDCQLEAGTLTSAARTARATGKNNDRGIN